MKLMDLLAEVDLDDSKFSAGIAAASRKGSSFASSLTSTLGGAASAVGRTITGVVSTVADLVVKATAVGTTLSTAIVGASLTAYAETEQLLGGVETLYGENAEKVIANADQAFMTAGMSANEYMETATSFAASLLKGLEGDTEAAAEYADMAIRDMSDNANKFGTDIAMIQNAYQGFAKGNYTMLDNLKLGYGGTAEEMAELINDSGVLGDAIVTAATVSEVPLDKIFEAIHVIQQEMGVTGTTAEEATETISGSFRAFKSSWENLLSGFANDDKNMDMLVDQLFQTGETLVSNVAALIPVIGKRSIQAFDAFLSKWDVYSSIKAAYTEDGLAGAFAEISAYVDGFFAEWGPKAYTAGTDLLANIYSGITGDVVSGAQIRSTLDSIWNGATTVAGNFVSYAGGVLGDIYEGFTGEEMTLQNIKGTLGGIWDDASGKMSAFLTDAGTFATSFAANFDATAVGELIGSVTDLFSSAKDAAGTLFGEIYTTLTGQEATAENIGATVAGVFNAGLTGVNNVLTAAGTFFSDIDTALGDPDATLLEKVGRVGKAASTALKDAVDAAGTFFSDLLVAIIGDEESAEIIESIIKAAFGQSASDIRSTIKSAVVIAPAGEKVVDASYTNGSSVHTTQSGRSAGGGGSRRFGSNETYSVPVIDTVTGVAVINGDNEDNMTPAQAIKAMQEAINGLEGSVIEAIKEGLSGISISVDGVSIANVVSTNMSRTSRSKKNTALSGYYMGGR